MSRIVARVLIVVAALSAFPSVVRAQGGAAGSIIGNVFDQSGIPIKGVKISATSPTQIGGNRVAYSNDDGAFRVPGLQPGTFEITATAPKLKTVLQKDIKVGVNVSAEVDIVMEVESGDVETVKVIEKAPIVSTTSPAVKEAFDEEFVSALPQESRTAIESFVRENTPGATGGGERTVRLRGGTDIETQYNLEGFKVDGQKIAHKALAAFEVSSAGQGAEYATAPGGVVNMVTKSGSNKFSVGVTGFMEDSVLQAFHDEGDAPLDHSYKYNMNPYFSGPIVKDRLWYYVSFEGRMERAARAIDPTGFFPPPPAQNYANIRGSAKLTWQVSTRNKIQNFSSFNRVANKNNSGIDHERDAQTKNDDLDIFSGLIWEAILSDKAFLRTQVGYSRFWHNQEPQRCVDEPETCYDIPSIKQNLPKTVYLQNSADQAQQQKKNRLQAVATLDIYLSSKALGEHNIKLKNDYYLEWWEYFNTYAGNGQIELNGLKNASFTEYFSNDPRYAPAEQQWWGRASKGGKNQLTLQDQARVTRYLTFTPGISLIWATANNSGGDTTINQLAMAPSISGVWDPTRDGRTALRASFANYADVDTVSLAQYTLGSQVSRKCNWDDTVVNPDGTMGAFSAGCAYSGGATGATIGLPCGPQGKDVMGRNCSTTLRIPRTWEYTVGAEREIVQGVGLGGDFVYRQFSHPYEALETNRIWNSSGTLLDRDGGRRNGRDEEIRDMETPDGAKRRYIGFTLAAHKREGKLITTTSYTISWLEGNVFNSTDNAWGNIAPRDQFLYGYLSDDSRHNLRSSWVYRWTNWLSTGMIVGYRTGTPFQRYFKNEQTGGFEDYRARVGIDPGTNINNREDDRPDRLPDQFTCNANLRVNLKPITGINFAFYVDFLNVLAIRTQTGVNENDGTLWGRANGNRTAPWRLHLGFDYLY